MKITLSKSLLTTSQAIKVEWIITQAFGPLGQQGGWVQLGTSACLIWSIRAHTISRWSGWDLDDPWLPYLCFLFQWWLLSGEVMGVSCMSLADEPRLFNPLVVTVFWDTVRKGEPQYTKIDQTTVYDMFAMLHWTKQVQGQPNPGSVWIGNSKK